MFRWNLPAMRRWRAPVRACGVFLCTASAAVLVTHLALPAPAIHPVVFDEVARSAGVAFQHNKSGTSRKYLIESVSGGVGMLDYDGDGWIDLYFVNGPKLKDPMKTSQ